MITVFFYLTDVEEGGQTVFPHALPDDVYARTKGSIRANGPCEAASKDAIRIPAVKGNAIIFYGMHPKCANALFAPVLFLAAPLVNCSRMPCPDLASPDPCHPVAFSMRPPGRIS